MNNLFSFFVKKSNVIDNSYEDFIIEIDENQESLQEICDLFGKILYEKKPKRNPIMEGTYFGGNMNSFSDCLSSYFYSNKKTKLYINIYNKNENITDSDLLLFLDTLSSCIANFEYIENRLEIYVSNEIIKSLNKEINRLHWIEYNQENLSNKQVES